MVSCCAFGCTNNSSRPKEGVKKSFHKFPDAINDKKRHTQWVKMVNRKDWVPSIHSRVCCDHFRSGDFHHPLEAYISAGVNPSALILSKIAVPTIFQKIQPVTKKIRKSRALDKRCVLEAIATYATPKEKPPQLVLPEVVQDVVQPEVTDDVVPEEVQEEITEAERLSHKLIDVQRRSKETQTGRPRCRKAVQVETWRLTPNRSVGTQYSSLDFKITTMEQHTRDYGTNSDVEGSDSEEEESESEPEDSCKDDPDYILSDESEDENGIELDDTSDDNEDEEACTSSANVFLVYESCLRDLLNACLVCGAPCIVIKKLVCGTLVAFQQECSGKHQHINVWESQPRLGKLPQGNLELATAMFASGAIPKKILNGLSHMGIAVFTFRTFIRLQAHYILAAVNTVWERQQAKLIKAIQHRPITLAGDARCCSPGHTAKYGSYSVMEMQHKQVLDLQLVQCNEVSSSNAMELEGLKRVLSHLDQQGITVESMVTDRHQSVKKYMATTHASIKHYFDVWHVAKGVSRKLDDRAKRATASCGLLSQWSQTISNHLYWIACTSEGRAEEIKAKWDAVPNHVANIHDHDSIIFPKCEHEPMDEDDRFWIPKESRAFREMNTIIRNNMLLKDIAKLSPVDQTSSLESFHRIVCYFAPKSTHYFYDSMNARIRLAGIHFNHNSATRQAITKDGEYRYSVSYPRYRHGKPVVKKCKEVSFGYVKEIKKEVFQLRHQHPTYRSAAIQTKARTLIQPKPIAHAFHHENKAKLVAEHLSRFSKR